MPSPPCPPQVPLLNVLSPEEIGMIHEHRRRNGTFADFSADPADDHQPPIYFGLSTSPPAQFQSSVTPSASTGPFSPSLQLPSPSVAWPLTPSLGLDPSLSVATPLLSMSPPPAPSCLASSPQQTSTNTQPSDLTWSVHGTPELDLQSKKQPTIGRHANTEDDDQELLDCMIHGYGLDFDNR
ncbi:hypothetical protein BU15DRAFT_78407 [Melanogaster broomeanus]|nr:hypothetical protein BU15DRAFT_84279 [Melanogaster broomeanus]KAF9235031.1 hypothetical protein BU15DRAFT_78407 [Melanogaster broomeanus]